MKLIVALALSLCVSSTANAATRVTVFVGAASRDGFVDATKDVVDSIKDLSKRLGSKDVVIVTQREDADIAVTVIARGVGSEPWGQRLSYQQFYQGAELASVPVTLNTWWVAVVLEVDRAGYRKEFVGTYTHPPGMAYYGGAWIACAKQLSKNLEVWIDTNRARVTAK
jgi:hypothetical protein